MGHNAGGSGPVTDLVRPATSESRPGISVQPFGTYGGQTVALYTLTNGRDTQVGISTFGGVVQSILVPDTHGEKANIVLGFSDLEAYVKRPPTYFGAVIGRYANRLANGTYSVEGVGYHAALNDGSNSLHGGTIGFDSQVWQAEELQEDSGIGVRLSRLSPDGEEGYPGNLQTEVTYLLTADNELVIHYLAKTDKPTIINLTNHSFFNLGGQGSGSVYDHVLRLNSRAYTPINAHLIPTGTIEPVAGTPFDFTQPTPIGAHIRDGVEQIALAHGIDHNFVLNRSNSADRSLILAASVHDPRSGRSMRCYTTEPGIQLYTGNFLDGSVVLANGKTARQSEAFCLETQHYPDSPNQPAFPSTVLLPGQTFDSTTVYRFS